jgi:hypothetical protein
VTLLVDSLYVEAMEAVKSRAAFRILHQRLSVFEEEFIQKQCFETAPDL